MTQQKVKTKARTLREEALLGSISLLRTHEIINSLCFPIKASKEIWIHSQAGALFVYCNEPIGKGSFIWACLAPNVNLGLMPYYIWFLIASGIGDYYNVYNTNKQVPQGARVFNYGLHSLMIKDN